MAATLPARPGRAAAGRGPPQVREARRAGSAVTLEQRAIRCFLVREIKELLLCQGERIRSAEGTRREPGLEGQELFLEGAARGAAFRLGQRHRWNSAREQSGPRLDVVGIELHGPSIGPQGALVITCLMQNLALIAPRLHIPGSQRQGSLEEPQCFGASAQAAQRACRNVVGYSRMLIRLQGKSRALQRLGGPFQREQYERLLRERRRVARPQAQRRLEALERLGEPLLSGEHGAAAHPGLDQLRRRSERVPNDSAAWSSASCPVKARPRLTWAMA